MTTPARVQGDGLPDRQDRRQARRRPLPRPDPERHHPQDAGVLRALDRLRRHQDPALRLREVPGRQGRADDADEVRRRGDGDGPHLPGVVPEGAALARDGPRRLVAAQVVEADDQAGARVQPARAQPGARAGAQAGDGRRLQRRRPAPPDRDRPVVPRADARPARHRGVAPQAGRGRPVLDQGVGLAAGQAARLLGPADRRRARAREPLGRGRARGPARADGARRRAVVPKGGHVRRGVRGGHAVHVLVLRRELRVRAQHEQER